ncbi:hypothetical protein [Cryptosporangium arvum]|uniref:hypothetical protein n=1 Tax=Cryptosporangium arvum TaxID=80871 RepID=UPI0004B658E7|nr:hypothetical protein [Cryptosporangium arvum]
MTIDAHDLDAATADPESPAWSRIWGESCRQGTCTPGSPALLPWLARTSAGFREGLSGAPSGTTWVYLRQAVLGFDGDEVWGRSLDRVNDGGADAVFPECDDELLLELTSDNPLITPGLSSPLAVRLHDEAVSAGHDAVATTLTHLFGQVTCPGCDATFDLADHVV